MPDQHSIIWFVFNNFGFPLAFLTVIVLFLWKLIWPFMMHQWEVMEKRDNEAVKRGNEETDKFLVALERRDEQFNRFVAHLERIEHELKFKRR